MPSTAQREDLVHEQQDALLPQPSLRRREVDQVAVVADGLFELQPLAVRLPLAAAASRQWRAVPLLLVLGEHLHRSIPNFSA